MTYEIDKRDTNKVEEIIKDFSQENWDKLIASTNDACDNISNHKEASYKISDNVNLIIEVYIDENIDKYVYHAFLDLWTTKSIIPNENGMQMIAYREMIGCNKDIEEVRKQVLEFVKKYNQKEN